MTNKGQTKRELSGHLGGARHTVPRRILAALLAFLLIFNFSIPVPVSFAEEPLLGQLQQAPTVEPEQFTPQASESDASSTDMDDGWLYEVSTLSPAPDDPDDDESDSQPEPDDPAPDELTTAQGQTDSKSDKLSIFDRVLKGFENVRKFAIQAFSLGQEKITSGQLKTFFENVVDEGSEFGFKFGAGGFVVYTANEVNTLLLSKDLQDLLSSANGSDVHTHPAGQSSAPSTVDRENITGEGFVVGGDNGQLKVSRVNAGNFRVISWDEFAKGILDELYNPDLGAFEALLRTIKAARHNDSLLSSLEIVRRADPAPYVQTMYDLIPTGVPTGAATMSPVKSGNWSDDSIWSNNRRPAAGDIVVIGAGVTVTYDIVSDEALRTVHIAAGGTLRFRTDINNTRLTVQNLFVAAGGVLEIGTPQNPVAPNVTAEIVFPNLPFDLSYVNPH